MSEPSLKRMTLDEVVQQCRQESSQGRSHERGCCFELFRRALEDHDAPAWAALERQYYLLLLRWLTRPSLTPQEAEVLVRETLERFWRTLASRGIQLSVRFDHMGSILRYLHQCALTTTLDHERRARRLARLQDRLAEEEAPAGTPSGDSPLEALCREERVRSVRAWLDANVTDPVERRLLELSFEQDLSPADIVARFPDEFPDIHAVRRIKERILRRAKRAFEAADGATGEAHGTAGEARGTPGDTDTPPPAGPTLSEAPRTRR